MSICCTITETANRMYDIRIDDVQKLYTMYIQLPNIQSACDYSKSKIKAAPLQFTQNYVVIQFSSTVTVISSSSSQFSHLFWVQVCCCCWRDILDPKWIWYFLLTFFLSEIYRLSKFLKVLKWLCLKIGSLLHATTVKAKSKLIVKKCEPVKLRIERNTHKCKIKVSQFQIQSIFWILRTTSRCLL